MLGIFAKHSMHSTERKVDRKRDKMLHLTFICTLFASISAILVARILFASIIAADCRYHAKQSAVGFVATLLSDAMKCFHAYLIYIIGWSIIPHICSEKKYSEQIGIHNRRMADNGI